MSKSFGGLVAVNRVDFQVPEGQVAGVIGPNGSGKTTLFNLLSGYFRPTAGSVRFLGKEVTDQPPYARVGMGMARTFQLVSVFNSLSVWENLVLSSFHRRQQGSRLGSFFFKPAREASTLADCRQALETVRLQDKAGVFTSELSYGDKRMLEIAIALSLQPKLLLLDEPLAGLSDHEIGEVLQLLHEVKDNFTLVIIEHKISKITDLVQRLSVMNEGSLICEGEPGAVLCDPNVRECYWGRETDAC
ncbi:MAG: ATP-binding cassette domain-containing protein [Desulfarculus sp.]|nr:MAG: ATP-binding cassette domain-containing protein [Desulfarculus sp.]